MKIKDSRFTWVAMILAQKIKDKYFTEKELIRTDQYILDFWLNVTHKLLDDFYSSIWK